MPISVTCECGKTLKAPDTSAGKKAKCPECSAVIKIPEQVFDAEEIDEYEDDEAAEENPYSTPVRSKSGQRKACPACGEMILADAAKCRFCDEVFDARLKTSSKVGKKSRSRRSPLAGPWKRLCGAFADGLSFIAFCIPSFLLSLASGPDGNNRALAMVGGLLLLIGILAWIILYFYLLINRSQSIGKYLVKTQIVDYETNAPASFAQCFLLRGVVNQFLCIIPFYGLVDAVCVFTDEHRCLHDRLAGTSVVDISE